MRLPANLAVLPNMLSTVKPEVDALVVRKSEPAVPEALVK